MVQTSNILIVIVLGLLLFGCTQQSYSAPSANTTTAAPNMTTVTNATQNVTQAPAQTTLDVSNNSKLGMILVDSKGMTLYLYTKDTNGTSVCYGGCAVLWPPLLVNGTPTSAVALPGTLGVTLRTNGDEQATYDGWPLYYYLPDRVPSDTTGQGVGNVWYVINATSPTQ